MEKRLLFPDVFSWAQSDPVFPYVQAENTRLGSKGSAGEMHQVTLMEKATALLDIYEAFMRDRATRNAAVFIPWPVDRKNKVGPEIWTYNFPKAVAV